MIGKIEIIAGLGCLGMTSGSKVIVHSSLKSFGTVDGGAQTVAEAVLQVVGGSGTVMMPVYTYSYEGLEGAEAFNPKSSKSLTGAVTEAFRNMPGVLRSCHPTHSLAVWGRNAAGYVKFHNERGSAFGIGTPIHEMAAGGGYLLLLGVGHEADSAIHTAECVAGMPYLRILNKTEYSGFALIGDDDGSVRRVPLEPPFASCSLSFGKVALLPEIAAATATGVIGCAKCSYLKLSTLIDAVVSELRKDPFFLLCPKGECRSCDKRRDLLSASGGDVPDRNNA